MTKAINNGLRMLHIKPKIERLYFTFKSLEIKFFINGVNFLNVIDRDCNKWDDRKYSLPSHILGRN